MGDGEGIRNMTGRLHSDSAHPLFSSKVCKDTHAHKPTPIPSTHPPTHTYTYTYTHAHTHTFVWRLSAASQCTKYTVGNKKPNLCNRTVIPIQYPCIIHSQSVLPFCSVQMGSPFCSVQILSVNSQPFTLPHHMDSH